MIDLGLSAADERAFVKAQKHSAQMRTIVQILDSNEVPINEITQEVLAGGVDVNWGENPCRRLEVTFLTPGKAPAWLPDSPQAAHVFVNNFIRIKRGIKVRDLEDGPGWVDVELFTGGLTGLSNDGDTVTITAMGKEYLFLDPHLLGEPMTLDDGMLVTTVARRLLAKKGQRHFRFPELKAKLRKKLSLGRHAQIWNVVEGIVGGIDRHIFMNGRGQAVIRKWPQNVVVTFKTGEEGTVLSKPRPSYDLTGVRNIVEVLGPEPKGPPKRIRFVARAKATNHLSAESLRWNGQPRPMWHVVDSNLSKPELEWHPLDKRTSSGGQGKQSATSIHAVPGHWGAPSSVRNPKKWLKHRLGLIVERLQKAKDIAERQLADHLSSMTDMSFECLPDLRVEEGDMAAASFDGDFYQFRMKTWTWPLTADEPMTVGFTKRMSWRDKIRKRRKSRKGGKKK